MTDRHEDLVALALGALDAGDATRVREEIDADPALRAEYEEVEGHLARHDGLPELTPAPALWRGLQEQIEAEPAARPSLVRRFWMPAAAAALVAAAFFLPRDEAKPAWQPLHGKVTATNTGTLTCRQVSRLTVGGGVTITADSGTILELTSNRRLALRAGRIFLEVSQDRRGYTVEAGDLQVVTTGTAFEVAETDGAWSVFVESGTVRCTRPTDRRSVGAGETYGGDRAEDYDPRAWFQRPSFTAILRDDSTITVVIRNEMPDPIRMAPPTGGEPFFFANYGEHNVPLAAPSSLLDRWPDTLRRDDELRFDLKLPHALPAGETVRLSWPAAGLTGEARR